jgi:CarboxypepD_reg-like domain
MKRLTLLLIYIIFSSASLAQDVGQFSGVILDKTTAMPIVWAHLLIKDSGTGTVSNLEDHFSINLPLDAPSIITISCVGYKSRSITFELNKFSDLKIFLEPDIKLLNEVIVKPMNVRQLILEAIKKIPTNYPVVPTMITGFYRESLKYDSVNYIYVSEGVLQARKESYHEDQQSGQVKLIKSRKKEFPDSLHTLDKIHFYAGPHTIHRFDFVIKRLEFINESKLKNYDYFIDDISSLNGKEIYKISFRPITNDGLFQGTLFLDVNSGIFISAKYKLTKAGLKHYENSFGLFTRYLNREYLVNYMQVGNKWMVQNIWQQGSLVGNRLKDTVVYATEFVTTEVDTLNTSPFQYSERLQYGDFFVDKADNLDPDFWKGFTILRENSFIQRLQDKELNKKSIVIDYTTNTNAPNVRPKSKQRQIRDAISKFSFDIAVTSLFPNYSISNVDLVGNGFSISSSTNQPSPMVFGLHYSLNMSLQKRMSVELGFTSSFGKLGFDNVSLAMAYRWQTTIRTRPLKFIGGLGFSHNSLYLPIGVVEGPLTVGGKGLSGKLDVNLQRQFLAFQPSIKIALELNRRWDFFIVVNYLFDLGIDHKILFEEQDGFFLAKKKASLKTNDPSIDFRVNSDRTEIVPLSICSLFMNTGVTFKYGR